jgi:hypothetical protein
MQQFNNRPVRVFHSIIIAGGTKESREEAILAFTQKQKKKINQNSPDIFLVDQAGAIGINIVRQIKAWLAKKAYQEKKRLVLIYRAQQLTIEAQNALLKTLEEPPGNTLIILAVNNSHQLLPTITSRCQIIRLNQKNNTDQAQRHQELVSVFGQDLGEKIIFAQKRGREEKEKFLSWIGEQSQSLRQNPNPKNLNLVDRLEKIKTMTQANITPHLALVYWLIKD